MQEKEEDLLRCGGASAWAPSVAGKPAMWALGVRQALKLEKGL